MDHYENNTFTMDATLNHCVQDNIVVDESLQKEMMNAETEKKFWICQLKGFIKT